MKKLLTLFLSALLVLSANGAVAFAESDASWSYDNSVLVTVTVKENRTFTPADFPKTCTDVYVAEKSYGNDMYTYTLLIVLDIQKGQYHLDKAISDIETHIRHRGDTSISFVAVEKNYLSPDYYEKASSLCLNENVLNLRVGETADLYIQNENVYAKGKDACGFEITFYEDAIDIDKLTTDSYSEYGIKLDTVPTQAGTYMAELTDGKGIKEHINVLNSLAAVEEIKCISIYFAHLAGNYGHEYWSVENESVASISLSGGVLEDYTLTPLGQTAKVKAESSGTTYITVEKYDITEVCVVKVFDSGDVNLDGNVDSIDAALVLKYDAGILGDEYYANTYGALAGDMNQDGRVDSIDAAQILKYDAGVL